MPWNIGAGKYDGAQKALFYSIAASLVCGLFMGYFAFFHGNLLAAVFSKDGEVVAAAHSYLKAYAIDTLFVSFLFCFIGYFNGCGKTSFVMIQGIVGAFGVRIPVSYLMSWTGSRWELVSATTICINSTFDIIKKTGRAM